MFYFLVEVESETAGVPRYYIKTEDDVVGDPDTISIDDVVPVFCQNQKVSAKCVGKSEDVHYLESLKKDSENTNKDGEKYDSKENKDENDVVMEKSKTVAPRGTKRPKNPPQKYSPGITVKRARKSKKESCNKKSEETKASSSKKNDVSYESSEDSTLSESTDSDNDEAMEIDEHKDCKKTETESKDLPKDNIADGAEAKPPKQSSTDGTKPGSKSCNDGTNDKNAAKENKKDKKKKHGVKVADQNPDENADAGNGMQDIDTGFDMNRLLNEMNDNDQLLGQHAVLPPPDRMIRFRGEIYIKRSAFDEAMKARTATSMARRLLKGIFKPECLPLMTLSGRSQRLQEGCMSMHSGAKQAIVDFVLLQYNSRVKSKKWSVVKNMGEEFIEDAIRQVLTEKKQPDKNSKKDP